MPHNFSTGRSPLWPPCLHFYFSLDASRCQCQKCFLRFPLRSHFYQLINFVSANCQVIYKLHSDQLLYIHTFFKRHDVRVSYPVSWRPPLTPSLPLPPRTTHHPSFTPTPAQKDRRPSTHREDRRPTSSRDASVQGCTKVKSSRFKGIDSLASSAQPHLPVSWRG